MLGTQELEISSSSVADVGGRHLKLDVVVNRPLDFGEPDYTNLLLLPPSGILTRADRVRLLKAHIELHIWLYGS